MVEQLSPESAGKTLSVPVLPGGPGRGLDLLDAEMVHTRIEPAAVDSVPIPDQVSDVGVEADGLHHLLSGPGLVRVSGDVHVEEPPPF